MAATKAPPKGELIDKPAADWDRPTNKAGLERLAPLALTQLEKGLPRFLAGQGQRLIRALITECQVNPALMDCTPASLFGAVIRAGQLGLLIGGPLGEAYLIPFGNSKKGGVKEATLVLGYKGVVQLAHRSDKIARLTPWTVREGDDFAVVGGTDQRIIHRPQRGQDRKPTDYYVSVKLVNGGNDFETFTFEDAVRFRDRYATARNAPQFVRDKSPWYDMTGGGFDVMSHKTLIKRLGKRLPLSVEMRDAIALDDQAEREESQHLAGFVLPPGDPDAETAADLRDRLDRAKAGPDVDDYGTPIGPPPDALFDGSGGTAH